MNKGQELKLVRKAAAGDRDSAELLVRSYQGSLYGYILRISGRPDVSEDVVQEAFVRVLTNLDRFDSRFRFSTWLFTIGRRVYFNMREKKRPTYDSEHSDGWRDSSEPGTGQIDRADTVGVCRDVIQAELMRLPADQREVVVLFHQHEWPIALIAEHTGLPVGTVKSHLHRARIKLREWLLHRVETPGVETLKFQEAWR